MEKYQNVLWRNTKKKLNTTIILNFEPAKQLLYCHVYETDLDWHVLQPYKVFHSDIHCSQLFVLLKTKHRMKSPGTGTFSRDMTKELFCSSGHTPGLCSLTNHCSCYCLAPGIANDW